MKKQLENLKNVIDADSYATGGILDRAKDAAVTDKNKEAIQDIVVGSRCKKHHKSKTKRK